MATITRSASTATVNATAPPRPSVNRERRRPPAPTVAELERQLLERDRPFHVEGWRCPDALAVERERRRVAQAVHRSVGLGFSLERVLRASEVRSIWNAGLRSCAWCDQPIDITEDVYPLGGRLVHQPRCLEEFDRCTRDAEGRPSGEDVE